jgi:transposase-like protein
MITDYVNRAPDLYYSLKDLRELIRQRETDNALALVDEMLDAWRKSYPVGSEGTRTYT